MGRSSIHERASQCGGPRLVRPGAFDLIAALEVINNWRSSHNFPLNTFQIGLRGKARQIDGGCTVAQRIKRLSSIEQKLVRFPNMTLSQMQDIGGCRAIVGSVRQVKKLCELYEASQVKHRINKRNDYISAPKESGYRGVHLIWNYHSDKKTTYNGLKIEMQIRSKFQHAWATAVETVGTFVQQALKSSQGEQDWLRFFALMGSAIALRERAAIVPGTPTNPADLIAELRQCAARLEVGRKLKAYGDALQVLEKNPDAKDMHFFLLKLDPSAQEVEITAYKLSESAEASADYLEVEKEIKQQAGGDAVLVSVDSLAALRRAYPNYFLDTDVFLRLVDEALTPARPIRRRKHANGRQMTLI